MEIYNGKGNSVNTFPFTVLFAIFLQYNHSCTLRPFLAIKEILIAYFVTTV